MGSIELLVEEVKQVKDFRKARGQRYKLYNLLAIIILAVISGADDFVAIAAFCKGKKSFLIAHGLLDGKNTLHMTYFGTFFSISTEKVLRNYWQLGFKELLSKRNWAMNPCLCRHKK